MLENELSKCCAAKAAAESKIKESRKKHVEEARELQEQATKYNKVIKAKNKVNKDLINAREVIKTKLEGERTLEKRIKIISRAKETVSDKDDTNKNDGESKSKPGDVNNKHGTMQKVVVLFTRSVQLR